MNKLNHSSMKKTFLAAVAGLALAVSCTENTPWSPVGDHIRTRWAQEVSPSHALPEYPRPTMVRPEWKSLNGLWNYAITSSEAEEMPAPEGKILVPFCIESSLSGVGKTVGKDSVLWYERSFTVPRSWRKDRTLLHFDAVDWKAEVCLNGQPVTVHTGGYTRFSVDITPYLVPGKQHLTVRVTDGTDNDLQPRGKQVTRPGGIWYTSVTGIWQSVWMEPVPSAHITGYQADATLDGTLSLSAGVDGEADELVYRLLADGTGSVLAETSAPVGTSACLKVEEPELWSPERPYLYGLEVELRKDGQTVDAVKGYTAIRESAEVRDAKDFRRMGLNGKPYFQFGPLDQGWWPDGLYTAPTDEALKFDIEKTRDFGFNMIRKHIKVEPERWYYWADRLGICVWQDMPSIADNMKGEWGQHAYNTGSDYPLSDEAKATYYKEWKEIMLQLRNHPSIVVWVPFNEAWGQFDTEKVVDYTRSIDATRLINSASGGNSRLCGDILDNHNYPNPVMKFRSGGAQIDVLGEYGGIGYAVPGHLWQENNNWGYQGLAKDSAEVLAIYSAYAREFIPEILSGVSAGVYTQTTDVEGEVNGLMTYDRAVIKMDEKALRAINEKVIATLN